MSLSEGALWETDKPFRNIDLPPSYVSTLDGVVCIATPQRPDLAGLCVIARRSFLSARVFCDLHILAVTWGLNHELFQLFKICSTSQAKFIFVCLCFCVCLCGLILKSLHSWSEALRQPQARQTRNKAPLV